MSDFRWYNMNCAPRDGTAMLMVLAMPYKQQVIIGEVPTLQVVIGDLYDDESNTIWSPDGTPHQVLCWAPIPHVPDLPEDLDDLAPAQKERPAP